MLAVGANGLRAVMRNSAALAARCPELARAAGLGSINVAELVKATAPRGREGG